MPGETATLNAENPHRNPVRNTRKKLDAILELKSKDHSTLTEEQMKKVKSEKRAKQDVAEAEAKYDEWEKVNGAAAAPPAKPAGKKKEEPAKKESKKAASPQAAPASAPAPAKKNGDKPAPKNGDGAKKGKQAAKHVDASPKAAPQASGGDLPSLDAKEEKTLRNKVKNLNKKLVDIAELKKKNKEELDKDQVAKVKTEKKTRDELEGVKAKLVAYGLEP